MEQLDNQALLAAGIIFVIEKAKKYLPKLFKRYKMENVHWFIAVMAAGVSAAGLTFKLDPKTTDFVLSGSLTGIAMGLVVWAKQLLVQYGAWRIYKLKKNGDTA